MQSKHNKHVASNVNNMWNSQMREGGIKKPNLEAAESGSSHSYNVL